jgi:hypothetical protein
MNSWSRTRKNVILAIVLFVAVALVGAPTYLLFHQTPSCFDGAMNGDEAGVDCGGSCQRLCAPESLPLVIEGDARVLKIATSTYEVVALFENPNRNARVKSARYAISLYAEGSLVPIKRIEGAVFVPKGANFAVFEGPFALEEAVPTRALIEWDRESLVWEKDASPLPDLAVKQTAFSRLEASPRLEAVVENNSLDEVRDIDLTALILDANGNIMAASKTYIDALGAQEEKRAIFSWPAPFASAPIQIQVIVTALP